MPGTDLPETPAGPYHRRKCHPVDRHTQTRTSSLSPPAPPAIFRLSNFLPTEATNNQPYPMSDRAIHLLEVVSRVQTFGKVRLIRASHREKKAASVNGGTTPPAPGK